MDPKDIVSIVKDVIVAIAATVTAVVAIVGINSWRRETRGKAQFESARALLLAAFKIRNQIQYCRSAFISAGEFPPDLDWASGSIEEKYKAYAHVYSTRWTPVREAMEKFEPALLDAEAVLGPYVKQAAEPLTGCARKLFAAIEMILSDKRSGNNNLDKEARDSFMKIVQSIGTPDAFGQTLIAAVETLEKTLAPHIKREHPANLRWLGLFGRSLK